MINLGWRLEVLSRVEGWQGSAADAFGARMRSIAGRLIGTGMAVGDGGAALGVLAGKLDDALAAWAKGRALLDVPTCPGVGPGPDQTRLAQALFAFAEVDATAAQRGAAQSLATATSALTVAARQATSSLPRPPPPPAPVINPCGVFPQEASSFFWNNGMIPLDTQCLVYTEIIIDVDGAPVSVLEPVPVGGLSDKGPGRKGRNRVDPGDESPLTPEQRLRVSAGIRRDLAKGPDTLRFQAETAQEVRVRGEAVVAYGEKVYDKGGKLLGEIDFETKGAIVEVTTKDGQKLGQAVKYATDPRFNPEGKDVIAYAPSYTKGAERALAPFGIKVARSMDQLMAMLRVE